MNTYSHEAWPIDGGAVITRHCAYTPRESGFFVPTDGNEDTLTIAQLEITPDGHQAEQVLSNGLILPGYDISSSEKPGTGEIVLCDNIKDFKETLPPFVLKVLRTMGSGAMMTCIINNHPNFSDQPARKAFLEAFREMSGDDLSPHTIESQNDPALHTGQYL